MLNTETFNIQMPAECLAVYLYLLSKPDDWDVSASQLAKHFDCSDARIYRIVKKLLRVEYNGCRLVVKTGQAKKGKKGFAQIEYTVSEPTPKSTFLQNDNALAHFQPEIQSKPLNQRRPACDGFMHTLTTQTLNDEQQITVFNKQLLLQTKRKSRDSRVTNFPALVKSANCDQYRECANSMWAKVQALTNQNKSPDLEAWADDIRKLVEIDRQPLVTAWEVFQWANRDDFWQSNILSPKSLRKQFPRLIVQHKKNAPPDYSAIAANHKELF